VLAGVLGASVALTGCGADLIRLGQVAETIDAARVAIADESGAWREELQKLSRDLDALESKTAADAKDVVTSTTNQVAQLTEQAIELTDTKVQGRIAQAGAEFRCNADFVRESVTAELQYLVDDLRFWETHNKLRDVAPPHQNCWVTPTTLSLYPADGGGWAVDAGNMLDPGVVELFGYAYRSDALPTVTLYDATGTPVRGATITPAYVTRYQINLDLSTETFVGVKDGDRLVLDWPDSVADSTTIILSPRPPAQLQIQATTYSSTAPQAGGDPVNVTVKVANTGGDTNQPFTVTWTPDAAPGTRTYSFTHDQPLRGGESVEVALGPHTYVQSGDVSSTVSISSGGSDVTIDVLHVRPPPPKLTDVLSTGDDCDAITYQVQHNAAPAGHVVVNLRRGPKVTWWKGIAVPVTWGSVTSKTVLPGDPSGFYTVVEIQDGAVAGTEIALADLDRTRPVRFGKAKGWGNHTWLAFTWDALTPAEIDPLDQANVTLTWDADRC
jgi:hypothetical protein